MNNNSATRDDCSDDLLADFLDESNQLIERINERLMELEEWTRNEETRDLPIDEALLNDMFRSAHSIKGLSAMLGLPRINELTHNIENVFDAARRGQLHIDHEAVKVVYVAVDRLSEIIDHLRDNQNDDLDCEKQLNAITEILEAGGALKKQGAQDDVESAFSDVPDSSSTQPSQSSVSEPIMEPAESNSASASSPVQVDCREMFADVHDESEIPAKYLAIFLDETELSLDEMVDLLLGNDSAQQEESVRTMMCTAHRIKGSAASIGLNRPAKLAHLMEDVLQQHRDAGKALVPVLIDALLGCADALRTYLKGLRSGEPVDVDFPNFAGELLAAEAACESTDGGAAEPVAAAEENKSGGIDLAQLQQLANAHYKTDADHLVLARVALNPATPLVGLKAQLLCEKLSRQGVVLLTEPPREMLENLSDLSEVVIGMVTAAEDITLGSVLNVSGVNNVQLDRLPREGGSLPTSVAEPTAEQEVEQAVTQAEELVQSLINEEMPEEVAEAEAPGMVVPPVIEAPVVALPPEPVPVIATPPKVEPAPVVAKPAAKAAPAPVAAAAKPPAEASKQVEAHAKPAETLRVDIERLDQLMNLAGQLVISKARFNQLGENLRDAIPHKQCHQWMEAIDLTCQKMLREAEDGIANKELATMHGQIRKMQQNLASIGKEMQRIDSIRTGLTSFFDAVHQLDRVTDGIQKTIMDTRMVPIGPLFGRFRRVVRDISRTNGKEITLEIFGEKTELDKRMIDELGDPLIHMVRNSADHGIETPSERKAAGKPECGVITLNAFHRGNSIVIQVTDDGRGLSREKITKKAIEKGLATPSDLERMTDQQIYQLIWEPGFSTAEAITEISGRGMGMDIVRAKIESINGVVEVDSKLGQGTIFTIKLPLTMAILPSLMAKIDGDLFSIPVESIVEIVCFRRDDITTVHGKRTALVRGRPVSICELHDTFSWGQPSLRTVQSNDVTMIIIRNDSREMGLVVDGILGEEDVVVKSLAENYQNVEGISGACVLGNGRVALILDPAAVIDLAVRSQVEEAIC
ncbi:chemotaxis protein CheA [Bremerella cremea]|uniref:chemotaxis protein CheA n=1 Tax=Bremerella cremea TaxID=1031537 RepID=UPI0031F13D2F